MDLGEEKIEHHAINDKNKGLDLVQFKQNWDQNQPEAYHCRRGDKLVNGEEQEYQKRKTKKRQQRKQGKSLAKTQ